MAEKIPPRPPGVPEEAVYNRHFGVDLWWAQKLTALQACCIFFVHPTRYWELGGSRDVKKVDWFWGIVSYLWGPQSQARKKFLRNPWVGQMAEAACEERWLGLSGCASSGKSDFLAIWGLVNWFVDIYRTKVFVTSTSLSEARNRIWGKILEYWNGCAHQLPGKVIDSQGIIRPIPNGNEKPSTLAGIQLIAGEQSSEKEAIGKLIGFKQARLLLLADELSDITPAILEAAKGNLAPGNKDTILGRREKTTVFGFQMIAASNFKGYIDPFGVFVEPETSWRDITVETLRWRTKIGGLCIRFDGMRSPNLAFPEDKFPIYGRKDLEMHKRTLGPNTALFWRMCRSFPAPVGAEDVVYTQNDLLNGSCFEKVVWSERPKIRLSALDPSFTSGGDRCIMHVGELGFTTDNVAVLNLVETIHLREDVLDKRPFDRQILDQYRKENEARGITRDRTAFDATGSGISFGTLIQEVWGDGCLPIKFGGNASDLPAASGDEVKPAVELYANRVTELWFQGKEYIRSGQIRGITSELADEMCNRKYDVQKGKETRTIVESKRDIKSRGAKSPDLADAFFILLELARVRFGFHPVGMVGSDKRSDTKVDHQKVYNDVYADEVGSFDYELEEA